MLLGVAAGGFMFLLAAYCWISAIDRIGSTWQRQQLPLILAAAIVGPATVAAYVVASTAENLRVQRRGEPLWLRRLRSVAFTSILLDGGAFFTSVGLVILTLVLPAGTILALLFGLALVGGAFPALSNHRRGRQWLIAHGAAAAQLFYVPAVLLMGAVGVLVLVYGL